MNNMDKEINITKEPVTYDSFKAAYTAIRNQFNSNYCCRVRQINCSMEVDFELGNKYYVDVFKRDSNQLVGYLGEYNGQN